MKSAVIKVTAGILTLILCLALCACTLIPTAGDEEGLSEFIDSANGYSGIMGRMSYAKAASILKELGIDGVTDEAVSSAEEVGKLLPNGDEAAVIIMNLLETVGFGTYDGEMNRIPTSTKVFSFDFEAYDIETMYADYLNGVSYIGGGELDFENVVEDYSEVDFESGTGMGSVSFDFNGERHTIEAIVEYDWLDSGVMNQLSDIIASGGGRKNLYYCYDSNQGQLCVAFYCTPEWAFDFTEKTGIDLYLKFYN